MSSQNHHVIVRAACRPAQVLTNDMSIRKIQGDGTKCCVRLLQTRHEADGSRNEEIRLNAVSSSNLLNVSSLRGW